jgi:hypothetical protein
LVVHGDGDLGRQASEVRASSRGGRISINGIDDFPFPRAKLVDLKTTLAQSER